MNSLLYAVALAPLLFPGTLFPGVVAGLSLALIESIGVALWRRDSHSFRLFVVMSWINSAVFFACTFAQANSAWVPDGNLRANIGGVFAFVWILVSIFITVKSQSRPHTRLAK